MLTQFSAEWLQRVKVSRLSHLLLWGFLKLLTKRLQPSIYRICLVIKLILSIKPQGSNYTHWSINAFIGEIAFIINLTRRLCGHSSYMKDRPFRRLVIPTLEVLMLKLQFQAPAADEEDDDDVDLFGEETEEEKKAAEERAASVKTSAKKKECMPFTQHYILSSANLLDHWRELKQVIYIHGAQYSPVLKAHSWT